MQAPQGNPLLLSHTLQELLSKDSVQVELIPEKKGLFLKHVEYEVSSKVMNKLWSGCIHLRMSVQLLLTASTDLINVLGHAGFEWARAYF